MRYFLNFLGRLLSVLGFLLVGSVQAQQFTSLHQFPVVYNISSSLDSAGNLNFTQTRQLFGFKEQYSPTGVSGCVLGYPEWRSACEKVNGGFSFGFDSQYTDYQEFRVFVPAGTTFYVLRGFLPQSAQYAAAVRFGTPPTRTTMLSPVEYENAKRDQHDDRDFARLLAGEERILVHDGNGVVSLTGTARLSANPLAVGQWLYIRVLNSSPIYSLTGVFEVNLDQYKAGFNAIEFGVDGDPPIAGSEPPAPVVATATVENLQQETSEPVTLLLKVNHLPGEITPGAKVSYYTGALIPTHMFGMAGYSDVVFFLANTNMDLSTPANLEWSLLYKDETLDKVAFERERPLLNVEQFVRIPLFLNKENIKHLSGRVRFGYMLNDGQFKVLDLIWDPEISTRTP